MAKLEAGATAPAFTLPDQDGKPVKLSDFKGQRVIVYFYPADDTPGCTKEACQFNDNLKTFEKAGVAVLGISPDKAEKHVKFRTKYKLKFPLLTDADKKVMEKYGAWGEKTMYGKKTVGTIRSTFLVGPERQDPAGLVQRAGRRARGQGARGDRRRTDALSRVRLPRGLAETETGRQHGAGNQRGPHVRHRGGHQPGADHRRDPDAVLAAGPGERAGLPVGWVVALAARQHGRLRVSHDGNVATSSTASDSVSWGKIALGVALLALARRNWRKRPAPGEQPAMPKWLATVESVSPVKAFGLAVAARRGQPEEPDPHVGRRRRPGPGPGAVDLRRRRRHRGVRRHRQPDHRGAGALRAVRRREGARHRSNSAKTWLTTHNAAVMAVLFLVFGVDLIAKGLPPLTS